MLVPTTLETQAIQVVKSGSVKGADVNANIINPVRDLAEIIAEPRLDEASTKIGIWPHAKVATPLKWRT